MTALTSVVEHGRSRRDIVLGILYLALAAIVGFVLSWGTAGLRSTFTLTSQRGGVTIQAPDLVLPTLPAGQQPMTRARTAAWLLARLVGKYGWEIQHLGEDIAGGGFIANIPGDVQAIFPAFMEYDGTAAAALARMLPQVPAREVRVLARLDYRALWAAGQAGSGRR